MRVVDRRRRRSAWIALPALLLLPACAGLWSGWGAGPDGLAPEDDRLRKLLRTGRADSALAEVVAERAAPSDELLRKQYEGLLAHYAGEHDLSNAALQRAAELAEERYTRSVTKGALSLLVNDRVLTYRPPRTERLLLHYYGLLNYLALGDPEGAAVEARRLSHLLDLHEDAGHGRAVPEASLHAALRTVAGAAFEAAGEWNDAAVAYRLASRARAAAGRGSGPRGGTSGSRPPATRRAGLAELPAPSADSGDVIVVLERGFVPHRAESSLNLLLWPDEIATLRGYAADSTRLDDDERAEAARRIAERLLATSGAGSSSHPFPVSSGGPAGALGGSGPSAGVPVSPAVTAVREAGRPKRARRGDDGPRLFRAAWPKLVGGEPAPLPAAWGVAPEGWSPVAFSGGTPVSGAGDTADGASSPLLAQADLAASLRAEFHEQAPLILAKALLRGVMKYSVAELLEEEVEEENEVVGELAGIVANAGLSLLERADTRSWHLLPGRIGVVRLRAPAGTRPLRLGAGLDLGTVRVPPGGVTVVSARCGPSVTC